MSVLHEALGSHAAIERIAEVYSDDSTPEAWLATVASIGHTHIGILDQEVAGASLHWDGQVPDGRAVGRHVVGNLLAVLVHPEHLQEAARAVSDNTQRAAEVPVQPSAVCLYKKASTVAMFCCWTVLHLSWRPSHTPVSDGGGQKQPASCLCFFRQLLRRLPCVGSASRAGLTVGHQLHTLQPVTLV